MVNGDPGHPKAYGHRGDMGKPQFDDQEQDYPNDCYYWAWDRPAANVGPGDRGVGFTLQILYNFYGVIIDTCNGGKIAGPKAGPFVWQWRVNRPLK